MYIIKILAVDDEPHMRSGIVRVLNNHIMTLADIDEPIKFVVETAESGEEALEKINIEKPDVLLLDYKMQGMTGLDVLEKVDNSDGSMVTIMITAFASLQTAVSAIKTGAFDFVAKPFTPSELKQAVSKAVQSLILARHVKKLTEEKRQIRFQFISVLGHELKAPLSAIEGYLDMFRDKSLGDALESYEFMINRCLIRTEQMRKLIVDILEMTKIESGTRQREIVELDLSAIVTNSMETFSPDAQKRNITINFKQAAPFIFNADKMEMEMVFNNLISNAVKYNRDNGSVDVILNDFDDKIEIKISDTGIGMSQEETPKLFGEFSRIRNKKTKDISGSGLGLSTLKKLSQLYGGDITVESTPDVGTTFTMVLKK